MYFRDMHEHIKYISNLHYPNFHISQLGALSISSDNQGSTVYTFVQILSRFSKQFWSKYTKIITIVNILNVLVKHCESFVKQNFNFYN